MAKQGSIYRGGRGGSFSPKAPSFPPKRKEKEEKKKREREKKRERGRIRRGGDQETYTIWVI
jgi:hypothetical protein